MGLSNAMGGPCRIAWLDGIIANRMSQHGLEAAKDRIGLDLVRILGTSVGEDDFFGPA